MKDDDDESTTIEDDLKALDRTVVHFDFSAWDSFRKSISAHSRESVRQMSMSMSSSRLLLLDRSSGSLRRTTVDEDEIDALIEEEENSAASSEDSTGSEDDDDVAKQSARPDRHRHEPALSNDAAVKAKSVLRSMTSIDSSVSAMDLTDEERYDNAVWRLRLLDGSMFQENYEPLEWEAKEMDAIAKHLALKDQKDVPFAQTPKMSKASARAINAIFFPERPGPGEVNIRRSLLMKRGPVANVRRSVLLKRGPVLLNGEERELMIFTDGFLFSHVELDSLASMLLDGNPHEVRDLTCEQLEERFKDIDADQSGSLDRNNVIDYFRSAGRLIGEKRLDELMEKFDSDSDGAISVNDFRSTMTQMKREANPMRQKLSWQSLGLKLRRNVSRGVKRKLDMAFQRADVEKIENLGVNAGSKTQIFADSEWAHLTLAVHVRGGSDGPLLVTCAKPGHVEAWVEAFRTFVACEKLTEKPSIDERTEKLCPHGVICGKSAVPDEEKETGKEEDTEKEQEPEKGKVKRKSLMAWMGSTVDWG